jgi:tetratricopeptide (TPR) repeat protein
VAVVDRSLIETAGLVADGGTPDWTALESSADAHGRAVLARLRTLSSIARLHDTLTAAGTATVPAVRSQLAPGAKWGEFEILEAVGSGRFGDVYRAFEPALDREVALKILAPRPGDEDDDAAVVEEGRMAARLRHPNIVTIYGARRVKGQTGVWMEFLHGRTLEAELAEHGPFDAVSLTRVAIQLGGALAAVHAAGLLHRDIKTANVMRDAEGRVVLGDFGTGWAHGRNDDERSGLTGTPAYIAPEIFAGRPATAQSDIYSLGVLLFRLATGGLPVGAHGLRGFREAHATGASASVSALRPDLPRRLAAAIDRAIAVDVLERFDSAAAFTRAVDPLRRGWPVVTAAAVTVLVASGFYWFAASRQHTVSFEARDWVLVTAFDNLTTDAGLDAAIVRALEDELRASTFANVVPRERVNDALLLMGQPTNVRLDAPLGREVAARDAAIRALVTGEVRRSDEGYTVSAQILAPDGSTFARMNTNASDFFEVVGQAAAEIRRRLGEALPSIERRQIDLPRVSTKSLRALQQYAQAMQLFEDLRVGRPRVDQRDAIEQLLRLAIAEDPEFAMAHLRLAILIGQQVRVRGRRDEAAAHARRALDLGWRLADADRLHIVAQANLILGFSAVDAGTTAAHFREAEAAFDELLRQQPDHAGALTGLADLYMLWNRPADQLRVSLRIGKIRPNAFGWRARAAQIAFGAGDLEQTRTFAGDAARFLSQADFEREPFEGSWIKLFPAIDAWLQRDADTSLRLVDRVANEVPGAPASTLYQFVSQIAYMYLTLGRLDQARAMADRLVHARDQPTRLQLAALASVELEDAPGVRRLVAGRPVADLVELGSLLFEAGLVGEWRRVNTHLRTSQRRIPNNYHRALLALAEGRAATGTQLLKAVIDGNPRDLQASIKLAGVQRASGDLRSAIATLERASQVPRWQTARTWVLGFRWTRMRAALAALYRQAGRIAEAEVVEDELRRLMAVADANHPVRTQLARGR